MEVEGTAGKRKLDIDQNCLLVKKKALESVLKLGHKKKALESVLKLGQRCLESLNDKVFIDDDNNSANNCSDRYSATAGSGDDNNSANNCSDRYSATASSGDKESDELCDLLKSRVECPDFLKKLKIPQGSPPQNLPDPEEGSSWDVVNKNDWGESGSFELDKDEYVLVKQEDIVDAMASFMATYLMSIKLTKDLSPSQLQEALGKTLNLKKKKGKLQKTWDGSKVIYNVASWGTTAVGIYQNPVILKVASAAFWTSCHVISKLF